MKEQDFNTIDEYVALFSGDAKERLQEIRRVIKVNAPEATETISYRMPTFDLNGKHLVYFAAFKNHIGFFPFPSGVEAFKKETSGLVTSKGTIQFPNDQPLPLDLVAKIVQFKVKENLERKSK